LGKVGNLLVIDRENQVTCLDACSGSGTIGTVDLNTASKPQLAPSLIAELGND
jgi:hypothetical protein